MDAPNENAAPSRSGMKRLIPPWEYRHLRAWAGVRFSAGIAFGVVGVLMLSNGFYGWAALFLVVAALHFSLGYLEMTVARTAPPEPELALLA